jgi:very-short-patch-repair endonuclease
MPREHLHYNRNLKPLARELRKHGTKGEALLWKKVLRARGMEGYQFNRQLPIGEYIVDFICRRLNLIVEIDGSSHISKGAEDLKRQEFLEKQGYVIMRFTEQAVVYRIDDVVKDIYLMMKLLEDEQKKSPSIPL